MKIMYVTTLGTWGGVATYLSSLINDQLNKNNDVYLVVGSDEEFSRYIRKKYPEVNIIIIPYLKRNIHLLNLYKAIIMFRHLLRNIKPDIIHLNCIMAGIMGRISCIGLNENVIYNAHGWAFEPGTSKKYKWPAIIIEKLLSYLTSKIICVSNYEYYIANKYHIFKNNSQGIIIKNGAYDIKLSHSKKLEDNVFRITMAARFWKQKDQKDLISAFYLLTHKLLSNKRVILYLLGDGPTLNKCKKLVIQYGMQNDIIFTGEVNNVLDYYNDSDIVTLITNYDAISISLIEALSMGKPIIASNVSGVPENFDNNGFCVNNNPEEIAYAIFMLLDNSRLRINMGNNSRKLFLRQFIQDINLQKHNNLYKSIIRS